MGKEWLFWGGGGAKSAKKVGRKAAAAPEVAAPTGCMCAVLQMFDLHQFQLALHHQPSFRQAAGPLFHDETYLPGKGVEAPRNSLEMDEHMAMESDSSSSSTRGKQQSLNIPAVTIQIKETPRASFSKQNPDVCSDSCSGADSPAASAGGNKTPTLVARLMGLDTTPPASAQRLQSRNRSSSHRSFFDSDIRAVAGGGSGTLSLPETPRISSARRSDVDHGHRHSLQINKENIEEAVRHMAKNRSQLIKQADHEEHRRSGSGGPSEYAKEIVKQFKENVSRKAGLTDITNTIKTRGRENYARRDDHVVLLKPNKPSSKEPRVSPSTPSSSSPRLTDSGRKLGKVNPYPNPQVLKIREEKPKKCKKDQGNENFRTNILKKKEEPFIRPGAAQKGNSVTDKKCKKTDIFNISVPTLLPVKKHQSQQSSSDGELWKWGTQQQQKQPLNSQEKIHEGRHRTTAATTSNQVVELEYRHYIGRILKRAGVEKSTPVYSAKWFSPAHPLGPSIFHYIELFHPVGPPGGGVSELGLRCNRRLVFQAVDELLAEILRKPRGEMYGSDLMDSLWTRIENFPRADCKVLEDIDALLAADLGKTDSRLHADYGEEEGEEIVEEIQREIVKSLVHDTTFEMIKGDYRKRLAAAAGGGGGG